MVKVTVLVAVYNAEKTLRKCLDSLMSQTMGDIQVICIDDASTDGSWAILQDYGLRDSRIETIRLAENVGLAKARNIGLRQARGKYVCFLDSDDWFSQDALESVVERFERDECIDCVLFTCRYVYTQDDGLSESSLGRTEDYVMEPFDTLTGEQAFELSLTWKIHGIYAVKLDIHQRIPYDEAAHSSSDENTTHFHYLSSRKVAKCEGIYYYRQHPASVTHVLTVERFNYLVANASLKRQMEDMKVADHLLDEYENVRWLNVIDLYFFYKEHFRIFSQADRQQALSLLRQAWKSIESYRLCWRNHYKLGYFPFHVSWLPSGLCWRLFRVEESLYWYMRQLFAKLR